MNTPYGPTAYWLIGLASGSRSGRRTCTATTATKTYDIPMMVMAETIAMVFEPPVGLASFLKAFSRARLPTAGLLTELPNKNCDMMAQAIPSTSEQRLRDFLSSDRHPDHRQGCTTIACGGPSCFTKRNCHTDRCPATATFHAGVGPPASPSRKDCGPPPVQ
jgi:hypothetical protein